MNTEPQPVDSRLVEQLIALARRERRNSLLLGVALVAAGALEIAAVVAIAAAGRIRPRAMVTLSVVGVVSLAFGLFLVWRGAKNRHAERSASFRVLLERPDHILHIDEIRRSATSIVRISPARGDAVEFTIKIADVAPLVRGLAAYCPNAEIETEELTRVREPEPAPEPSTTGAGWPF